MGERVACRYLRQHGYKILHQNFRCRLGEIDLIAREGGELVFIEVRTRRGTAFGRAEESIGRTKQQKVKKVAQFYLVQQGTQEDFPCRFDVVTVDADQNGKPRKIHLFRGAF